MSDWNVGVTKSSLDTSAALSGLKDGRQRKDSLSNIVGAASGSYTPNLGGYGQKDVWNWNSPFSGSTVTTGYDIVGIKGSMVEPMRESIRNYVSRVQKVMDDALLSNAAEVRKAIRGEEAIAEVNKYVEKVRTYCGNAISALLVFSDKLADVGNAWNAAQQNMASTISATTGAFSEGTAYTEGVQYTGSTSEGGSTAAFGAVGQSGSRTGAAMGAFDRSMLTK